jgi:hypothetical protein
MMSSSLFVTPKPQSAHGEFQLADDFLEVWLKKESFEVKPADPTKDVMQRDLLTLSNEVRGE